MLSEKFKLLKGLAPAADRFNTSPSTDRFNMENLDRITFLVYHQGGTTGVGTLTVEQHVAASSGTPVAIPFRYRRMTTGDSDTLGAISNAAAAGIDTVAAEDTIIEIEVSADALSAGYKFVSLKCAEAVNDPVNAVVIALGHSQRYGSDVTAIA